MRRYKWKYDNAKIYNRYCRWKCWWYDKEFKYIYDKLKIENNRHALSIKSQTSLHVMYIFTNFDNDQNLAFDEIEFK